MNLPALFPIRPPSPPGVAPLTGGGAEGAGDVKFRLLALAAPSQVDTATSLPESIRAVKIGTNYCLEVWASDVGDINTGLTSAYVDLGIPAEVTVVESRTSDIFNIFASGTPMGNLVDELGGSNLQGVGIMPRWSQVGVVTLKAESDIPSAVHQLRPSTSGVACLGRGVIPVSAVEFDSLVLTFGDAPLGDVFRRGDSNTDGTTDISDAVATLGYLFLGLKKVPCEQAGDANDDGALDISDAVCVLSFLFTGGKAIEPPVGACGVDPTGHSLPCLEFPGCQ